MGESIAKSRCQSQHISKCETLVVYKTVLYLSEALSNTLVCPGESEYTVVNSTTAYVHLYNVFMCFSGNQMFPPIIFISKE